MYLSSGLRHSLSLAASWVCAALILAAALFHYDDLKAVAGSVLGLPELQDQIAGMQHGSKPEAGESLSAATGASRTVELQAGRNGHFETEANINGRSIQVMVDTGASLVALTWEDAMTAGLSVRDADFTGQVRTANGTALVAPVTLDKVTIGDITVFGVRGVVSKPGALSTTLLGMSFLGKLSRAEMRRDSLILEQ